MSERVEQQNMEEKHLIEAERIAEKVKGFTHGCRVLMLIQRHSDGGHTNNSKLRSYISRGHEEWVKSLAKLLQEKEQYPHLPLRIYQTLNERDIEKGIREFKHASLEADYYDDEQRQWFYLDVRNRIVSSLMKPSSAKTSYFLFDVDLEEVPRLLELGLKELTEIVLTYKTKNGWHIITKPFNPNLVSLPENVELKKDSMMLLAF